MKRPNSLQRKMVTIAVAHCTTLSPTFTSKPMIHQPKPQGIHDISSTHTWRSEKNISLLDRFLPMLQIAPTRTMYVGGFMDFGLSD